MSQETVAKNGFTNERLVTNNAFAAFERAQINEFEVVFSLIDRNSDGFIGKDDLRDTLISLGKDPTDDYLEDMMNDAPGPINFTMFFALFEEKLLSTDPENVIKDAFGCFDENNEGVINEVRLRELLVTVGDRFTNAEVDELYCEAPISDGMFNYMDFIRYLKLGTIE